MDNTTTEISTITAALTSIISAGDLARQIKEGGQDSESPEAKARLADLVSAITEARVHVMQFKEILEQRDKLIGDLQGGAKLKKSISYEAPYYWKKAGKKKDGPFCQSCFDSEQKLIRLQNVGPGSWVCMSCKGKFRDSDYRSLPRTPIIHPRFHKVAE